MTYSDNSDLLDAVGEALGLILGVSLRHVDLNCLNLEVLMKKQ